MARRFVTAEDVRRVNGGEILVDEQTVVTPQALEAAEASGVVIRQAGGAPYAEPTPDRGPDAARAASVLPHMPEPTSVMEGSTGVVVTVVGRNRPGVLAEVTSALGELHADVLDISQKTVDQYFHLVLLVVLDSPDRFGPLKDHLQCIGGEDDFVVRVMHEKVFRFMHRV